MEAPVHAYTAYFYSVGKLKGDLDSCGVADVAPQRYVPLTLGPGLQKLRFPNKDTAPMEARRCYYDVAQTTRLRSVTELPQQ